MIANELRAPWWKWLGFSLALIVAEVAVVMAGMLLVLFQGVDLRDYMLVARPPFITDGLVAAGFFLVLAGQNLAPLLVLPLFRPTRLLAFAGFRRPGPGSMGRLGVGLSLALILQVVWSYLGPVPAEQWRMVDHVAYAVAAGGAFWPQAWVLLAVALVAPVCEEILFRGLLFGYLRRRWGFSIGAAVSALLFGLGHGLASALPAAALGFYLAYQVERDRSFYGAMALHALNNLGAVVILFVQAAPFR